MEFRIGDIVRIARDNGEGGRSGIGCSGMITSRSGRVVSIQYMTTNDGENSKNYYIESLDIELDPDRINMITKMMED